MGCDRRFDLGHGGKRSRRRRLPAMAEEWTAFVLLAQWAASVHGAREPSAEPQNRLHPIRGPEERQQVMKNFGTIPSSGEPSSGGGRAGHEISALRQNRPSGPMSSRNLANITDERGTRIESSRPKRETAPSSFLALGNFLSHPGFSACERLRTALLQTADLCVQADRSPISGCPPRDVLVGRSTLNRTESRAAPDLRAARTSIHRRLRDRTEGLATGDSCEWPTRTVMRAQLARAKCFNRLPRASAPKARSGSAIGDVGVPEGGEPDPGVSLRVLPGVAVGVAAGAGRRAMERDGIESLPLYQESRACRRPTARKVIDLIEGVQRHELSTSRRPAIVFTTKLSRLRRKFLSLLKMRTASDT